MVMRLFLLFLMVAIAAPAWAQDSPGNWQPGQPLPQKKKAYQAYEPPTASPDDSELGDFMSQPMYDNLVRQAIQSRPKTFEFGMLRSYYSRTRDYDPIGDLTRGRLVNLAYTAGHDPDPEKRKKALEEYNGVVSAHLANIDVITEALSISRQDRVFGDPSFFEWVQKGLMKDVAHTGNGLTLNGAYDVVTLGEETALMNVLRLQVLKTESDQGGGTYYNMHYVKDPRYARPYWIFVNVTIPMKVLERQKTSKERIFTLPPAQ